MKIHALSADKGGCHFYRIKTPLQALRQFGHETSWGTGATADELNRSDVLICQMLNGEQDLAGWEAVAAAPRRPLMVYEVDDDLFTIDQIITGEVSRKKVLWAEPEVQERVKRYIELADLVTTTTQHLADFYATLGTPVAVLPNAIPDWLLNLPRLNGPVRFTAGWTVSHSHLLDARAIIPRMDRFFQRHAEARFHWVGPPSVVGAFPDWQQTVTPWVGDVSEYLVAMRGRLTVGIAGLGDYPFNLGKSGIKADEYAAWGVPTIASDYQQYRDTVVDGLTGFLIKYDSQWGSRLAELYNNRELCASMGEAARELVSERTISKTCFKWIEAYERALDDRPGS